MQFLFAARLPILPVISSSLTTCSLAAIRNSMNTELLQFAEMLGQDYNARVTSWGRDEEGNKQVGGVKNSWHLWSRGANAIDLKPADPGDLVHMAELARIEGYQVKVYRYSIHIEVPW